MNANHDDWESYAQARRLGRNRLLLEHHQAVVGDFLQFFSNISTESHVFDVGCAAGYFLVLLRELGFNNTDGADVSETSVAYAREKGLRCRKANVLDGNISEGSVNNADFVLLMDVLEHLPDPAKALRNCAQLLARNGMVYITVPIYDSLTERLTRIVNGATRLQQAQQHDATHVQAFSAKEFHRLLKESGFAIIESKRLFCPVPWVPSRRMRDCINLFVPHCWRGMFLRVVVKKSE